MAETLEAPPWEDFKQSETPPWQDFKETESPPWQDFKAEPTGAEKAADSLRQTRALVRESRQSQLDQARREARLPDAAYSLVGGAETAADVLARSRPDLVAKSALGLGEMGVRKLLNLIPGLPKTPDEAPLTTQQPIVSPEQAQKAVEFFDPFGRASEGSVHQGLQRGGAELVSAATDPAAALSMGPVARVPALARPLFALPMVANIPEAVERVRQAKDTPETVAAALALAAQVALPASIERGLRTPSPLPLAEREAAGTPRGSVPFPPEATGQDILAAKRRTDYIAEQKAALEGATGVSESTLDRLEAEGKGAQDFQRASEESDLGAGAAKAVGAEPSQAEIAPTVESTPAAKPPEEVSLDEIRKQLYAEAESAKQKAQAEWPSIHDEVIRVSGLPPKTVEDALNLPPREGATHPSDYKNLPERLSRNYPGGYFTSLYNKLAPEQNRGKFLWGGTYDKPEIGFDAYEQGGTPDVEATQKTYDAFNRMRKQLGMDELTDLFGFKKKGGDLNESKEEKGQEEVAPTAAEPTIPSPAPEKLWDEMTAEEKAAFRQERAAKIEEATNQLNAKHAVIDDLLARKKISKTDAMSMKAGIKPVPEVEPTPAKRSITKDSQEFDALVKEHGFTHDWILNPDALFAEASPGHQNTMSIKAKILQGQALKQARLRAAGDIGLKGGDVDTPAGRAKALDALKAFIEEEKIREMERNAPENANTNFLPEESAVPKLGAGEKGTGELFKGADQPFNLAGESEVDLAKVQREKEAAAKQAEVAKPAQAKAQGQLPGTEHTGLGAAVPPEFGQPNDYVSNMFAAIDRDREAMGKPPMPDTKRRSWDEDNQKALAKMNRDPNWIPDLIADVTKSPRPLLSWENAGMVWQRHLWKAEANNALSRIAQAFDDGRVADLESAKLDAARFEQKLDELDKAVGRNGTGSEAGRSLQAQKMGAGEDFSLVEMRLQKRKANGGKPLTDAQSKEIQDLHDKLRNVEVKESEARQKLAASELARMLAETRAQPSYAPGVLAQAERFAKYMDKKSDAALERLKARMGRTSANVDPTILSDVAIIGAAKLTRGVLELAKWTDAMAADVGEWFREHAQEAYAASKKLMEDELAGVAKLQGKAMADKVKKGVTDIPERINTAKAQIAAKAEQGSRAVGGEVQKLFKALVEQNPDMTAREAAERMHGILKESMPDITLQETMDAISGRGKFWRPSQEVLAKRVRDLKTQLRLIGHEIDVEAGKPLPRTGYQPDKFSEEARQENAKLEELKRRHGVVVTNPATQLASALQSRKSYYTHRLADLKAEIASRARIVKTSAKTSDPALEALKAEYEKVKAEHNSIFSKELSDESKLKSATSAAERNLAEWNAKLEKAKRGDFSRDPTKPKLSTPELETIRAKAEAARNEVEHLKDLDTAFQEQKQVKALGDSIAEYERRIKENDLATSEKPGVSSPKVEALKAKRTALAGQLADLRSSTPEAKAAKTEAARKSVQQSVEELSRQINEGDVAPKGKSEPKVTSPELEQMRGERDQLLKIKQQLQNAAKPKKSAAEIAIQARKTAIAREIAELQDRIAKGDFSPKSKRTITPDPELSRLQTQKATLQKQFRKGLLEDELRNRSRGERVIDILKRIRREFVLSGFSSIGKLASYSAQEFALAPIKEAAGAALSKLPFVRDVAERAPSEVAQREAAAEVRGIVRDYVAAFTKGIRDAKDTWAGESELKAKYEPSIRAEGEFRAFFGTLHQMEKSPLIRLNFERSFRRRMENAADKGVDVTDPGVQQRIGVDAYQDGLRGALINRNAAVAKVARFVDSLAEKSKTTGRAPVLGRAAKLAFEMELPVQHVPANYVARTAEYIFGLGSGGVKVINAFRRGIESLEPAEADQIMRHLKSGSVGLAAMLTGFLLPQLFGGLWTPGGKKNERLHPGEIQIGPVTARHWATHNQLLNAAQFGATVRKVSEKKNQGLSAGAQAALWGLADEVPYAREISDFMKAGDPRQAGKFWQEKVKGYVIPQAVSQAAEMTDLTEDWRTIKRKPHSMGQALESGIPGLRQNVPIGGR